MQRTIDYCKIFLLAFLLLFCLWDGSKTLYGRLSMSKNGRISLTTNYNTCKSFDSDKSVLESCKTMIDSAYTKVNIKCQKYLDMLQLCKDKNRKGCGNYENNVNFCANTVLQDSMTKWKSKIPLK